MKRISLIYIGLLLAAGMAVSTLALDPPPARATHTTPGGTTYALSPGVAGKGGCSPISGGHQCILDGEVKVSVSDSTGCGVVLGPASCTVVGADGPSYAKGTSTLECADKNYVLSDPLNTKCSANDGVSMTCSQVSASCETGCGEVRGAASCKVSAKP